MHVLDAPEVRVVEFEPKMDLAGAKVVDGFPSVGLVSTIAGNYLIDVLKMKQIGVMEHPHFPTLTVVHGGEALAPVRIYAGSRGTDPVGAKEKLVVFVSEFQPNPQLTRPIARAILEWAKSRQCDTVISPEGLVVEGPLAEDDKIEVYGIGSTPRMTKVLQEKAIPPFKEGIITGVSGVLLSLGKQERYDVLSILTEAHANYPDARSAAVVIQTIARIIGLTINVDPLLKEAEGFERQLKTLNEQAKAKQRRGDPTPAMYG